MTMLVAMAAAARTYKCMRRLLGRFKREKPRAT
jgi:hypothetical protein